MDSTDVKPADIYYIGYTAAYCASALGCLAVLCSDHLAHQKQQTSKLIFGLKCTMAASFAVNAIVYCLLRLPVTETTQCRVLYKFASATFELGYVCAVGVMLVRTNTVVGVLKRWAKPGRALHVLLFAGYAALGTIDVATTNSTFAPNKDGVLQCSWSPIWVYDAKMFLDIIIETYVCSIAIGALMSERQQSRRSNGTAGVSGSSAQSFVLALLVSYIPRAIVLIVVAAINIAIRIAGIYNDGIPFFWVSANVVLLFLIAFDTEILRSVVVIQKNRSSSNKDRQKALKANTPVNGAAPPQQPRTDPDDVFTQMAFAMEEDLTAHLMTRRRNRTSGMDQDQILPTVAQQPLAQEEARRRVPIVHNTYSDEIHVIEDLSDITTRRGQKP
ncbi:hypothetical protein RI367_007101 [Sorochytrium milnesiophthora]